MAREASGRRWLTLRWRLGGKSGKEAWQLPPPLEKANVLSSTLTNSWEVGGAALRATRPEDPPPRKATTLFRIPRHSRHPRAQCPELGTPPLPPEEERN